MHDFLPLDIDLMISSFADGEGEKGDDKAEGDAEGDAE